MIPRESSAYSFHADPFLTEHCAHGLGPNGPGVLHFGKVIDNEHIDAVQSEINDPMHITWRDNRSVHTNARGKQIYQNYDSYALKLSHGDQEMVDKLPTTKGLVIAIENLIRYDLAGTFPSLDTWKADEMVLHRYDPDTVGITHHRDQKRFWGIIALMTLEGESQFSIEGGEPITRKPGHLLLMRGHGLYKSEEEIRPLHGTSGSSTSLIVRASTEPDKQHKGFTYDNWPIGQ